MGNRSRGTRQVGREKRIGFSGSWFVERDRLLFRLDEAFERRLTLVVAGAGFGKSTLLGLWGEAVPSATYALDARDQDPTVLAHGLVDALAPAVAALPEGLGEAADLAGGPALDGSGGQRIDAWTELLCRSLDDALTDPLVLVLDDVHLVQQGRAAVRLIGSLVRQAPPALHIVLASRAEPPFGIERLRGAGEVLELTARDLAFEPDEIAALLDEQLDGADERLVAAVADVTGGWPAAVRLAVEAMRGVTADERLVTLTRAHERGSHLFDYLASEAFAREPDDVRVFLRVAALLDRFTPAACEALGMPDARRTIASLIRRGLFVRSRGGDWYSLHALVRGYAREAMPVGEDERRAVLGAAAAWFEQHGALEDALAALRSGGDEEAVAALLERRGEALLRAGGVDAVVHAAAGLAEEQRTPALSRLEGEARQIRGDWDGALACYARAGAGADALPAALAWRMGLIHYLRGDLSGALETFERASMDGADPCDAAMVHAWAATSAWVRGERDEAARRIEAAEGAAGGCASAGPAAAVHTVKAMQQMEAGDRGAAEHHFATASDLAERAGDTLQRIRIHINHASHIADEGRYDDALAELDGALALADLAGFANFQALGLTNRGSILLRRGRLDEAIGALQDARSLYDRLGSRAVCYPLGHLGDAYRLRGDLMLARQAYEEAIAASEETGDMQGLVPALAGLARVLVRDEPEAARDAIERAASIEWGTAATAVALARAIVGLAGGDRDGAAAAVAEASASARARRDAAGLAEALMAQAAAGDPSDAGALLEEASAIWRRLGDPVGDAIVDVLRAHLDDPSTAPRIAEKRLRSVGVRRMPAGFDVLRSAIERGSRAPVEIECLGGFRLLRDGVPVPSTGWQSKKARDLLKILIARRGRPVPREELMDILWPDEDPAKLANRLSVALTTVRSVLDPEKRFSAEHFVSADKESVALEQHALAVDVERFLAAGEAGLRARERGDRIDAARSLHRAEELYLGDAFEEDPYEQWAVAVREEARAMAIRVARALAADAAAAGEHDAAIRSLLRLLQRDPYDEEAHLTLVRVFSDAGRHGEARRAYRTYVQRMEEIGVESASFPV